MIEIKTPLLFTKEELKYLKNHKIKNKKNKNLRGQIITTGYFLLMCLSVFYIYFSDFNKCFEFTYCILISLFSFFFLVLYFYGKRNSPKITNKEKQKIIREYYEL